LVTLVVFLAQAALSVCQASLVVVFLAQAALLVTLVVVILAQAALVVVFLAQAALLVSKAALVEMDSQVVAVILAKAARHLVITLLRICKRLIDDKLPGSSFDMFRFKLQPILFNDKG
jgi:hypothetical protein